MTRVTGPNGLTIDVPDVIAQGLLKDRNNYRDAGPVILGDGRTPADTPVPDARHLPPTGTNPAGKLNEGSFTAPDGAPKKVGKPRGKDRAKWVAYAEYKGVIVPEGADVDTIKQLVTDKETADATPAAASTEPESTEGAGDGPDEGDDGDDEDEPDEGDDDDN